MIDNTNIMTYKGVLRVSIAPQMPEEINLLETLQGLAYEYLRTGFGFEPTYNLFRTYGKVASEDETVHVQTGSTHEVDSQPYPFLWALRVRARDQFCHRRNWLTHVGIRQDDPNVATLYFAELYSDYSVGQMTDAALPTTETPALIDALLRSKRLVCLSGAHALAAYPWAITDGEADAFLDLLFDPERTLPILLITCPDLVSPNQAYDRTKGNLIVCWLDDYPLFCMLNERLPSTFKMEWDSVRVFMPVTQETQTYHAIPLQEVNRLGGSNVIENMRHAFCTCLRNSDRHAFVTIDTIRDLLRERTTAMFKEQNLKSNAELLRIKQENSELSAELTDRTEQLKNAKVQLEKSNASEYEALLTETLEETDRLNQGIDALIAHLYADHDISDPMPEMAATAKLRELNEALNYRFHQLHRWQ